MIVEHELDFVEGEVAEISSEKIRKTLRGCVFGLKRVLAGSLAGKKIGSGFRVALVGPPNAGKSSLFNSLLGYNKAIVSPKKGTTRDVVEAFVEIDGCPVILADTAGHHKASDLIESEGVKKTEEELDRADVVVVVDEKNPQLFIDQFELKNKPALLVLSKRDSSKEGGSTPIKTSAKKNINIGTLLTKLSTLIRTSFFDNEAFFAPDRQIVLLERSLFRLESLLSELETLEAVVFSSSLRSSINDLREVFGEVYNEDVLNNIFKGFCVGK
jgi:tRNA modification GTPase